MNNELYKNLPETSGVYLMKDKQGEILYIGKAGNLKRRVSSYFLRPHDSRIERLVSEIAKIDVKETSNTLEALVLESELIKKHQPSYNIREKDDKSFLYVAITKEEFPRILLVRGKEKDKQNYKYIYGPFVSASSIREALRIIRRIFPFSTHPYDKIGKFKRPCFDYEVGLCPGTCINAINKAEYNKNIKHIKYIFSGKMSRILSSLKKEMNVASKNEEFEKANKFKRQIFALQHIQDSTLVSESEPLQTKNYKLKTVRVEGYDISNISGTSAVGSMVVFTDGKPDKSEYRKFKINSQSGPDDTGMIREVISRRFSGRHKDWQNPDIILIDGGEGQVSAVKKAITELNINIPVVGIAKGVERKNNRFVCDKRTLNIVEGLGKKTLINVRDEAHRYAVSYHRKVRGRDFLS